MTQGKQCVKCDVIIKSPELQLNEDELCEKCCDVPNIFDNTDLKGRARQAALDNLLVALVVVGGVVAAGLSVLMGLF